MILDRFIEEIFVYNAISAALGRNEVYDNGCSEQNKRIIRIALQKQLQSEAGLYATTVPDTDHYGTIKRISNAVSATCPKALSGGRFRYGTAQKAFNLYLKFLWRSGTIPEPPHCPVDRVVLSRAKVVDPRTGRTPKWTECDCEAEYRSWIGALRAASEPLSLAHWEYKIWLEAQRREK